MKALFIALLFVIPIFTTAQENVIEIPLLKRGEILLDFKHLPRKGFILKTGSLKPNSKKVNWKLHSFDENLRHNWTIPIEKGQIEKGLPNYLVASSRTDYIYHLEGQGYNKFFGAKKWQITQVNGDKKKVFEEVELPQGHKSALLVTEQGLKIFVTGFRKNEKKGLYAIHTLEHDKLKQSTTILDLPDKWLNENGEEIDEAGWYAIYYDNDFIYFARKRVIIGNPSKEIPHEFNAQIAKCNYEGEVLYVHSLDPGFDNWNFAAMHHSFNASDELTSLLSATSKNIGTYTDFGNRASNPASPTYSLSHYSYIEFNTRANGKIVYDPVSNCFVVLGRYNYDIIKGGYEICGFFIKTFDESGAKLREQLIPIKQLAGGNDESLHTRNLEGRPWNLNYALIPEEGYIMEMESKDYWYEVRLNTQLDVISLDFGEKEDLTEAERNAFTFAKKETRHELKYMGDIRIHTEQGTYLVDVDKERKMLEIRKINEE